ncbi:MAG: hypothetical protein R3E10_11420 [Gemmatimonadota bacterium]
MRESEPLDLEALRAPPGARRRVIDAAMAQIGAEQRPSVLERLLAFQARQARWLVPVAAVFWASLLFGGRGDGSDRDTVPGGVGPSAAELTSLWGIDTGTIARLRGEPEQLLVATDPVR